MKYSNDAYRHEEKCEKHSIINCYGCISEQGLWSLKNDNMKDFWGSVADSMTEMANNIYEK